MSLLFTFVHCPSGRFRGLQNNRYQSSPLIPNHLLNRPNKNHPTQDCSTACRDRNPPRSRNYVFLMPKSSPLCHFVSFPLSNKGKYPGTLFAHYLCCNQSKNRSPKSGAASAAGREAAARGRGNQARLWVLREDLPLKSSLFKL